MKTCFKCYLQKPLCELYKHLNKCKECSKKDVRKNYRDNISYYQEYEKARAGLPHREAARADYAKSAAGIIAGNRCKKAWVARNPIKKMASTIVSNAIRGRRLEKSCLCECCGSSNVRLHGHHDDYAFPLVVRWLCPRCHNKWHRENGPGKNAG